MLAPVRGDEAHIIGERPVAARGHLNVGYNDLDDYDNLILLCKVHHKLIDDQPATYPVERLRAMKAAHEHWVRETLARKPGGKESHVALLHRISTGTALSDLIVRAMAFLLDHDEPETEEEARLIDSFFQEVQDWSDIWSGMESSQHVEVRFLMTKEIRELEAAGLLVFDISER